MVYGHANGRDIAETRRRGRALHRAGLQGDPRAVRRARTAVDLRRRRRTSCSTSRPTQRLPTENVWSTTKYLDHVPKLFERAARRASASTSHLLHDVHHRLTPIEAARLGKSLEPYRLFWMEDPTPAENQAGFPADPPAHGHAARGRRSLQHDLGLQAPDRGAAHRLHPHDRRACRRHHAPAAHRRLRRALPGAHRLSWRHRSVAGLHGRRAALRPVGAELRRPGIHAAHRPRPTRCSRTPTRSTTATCIRARRRGTASTSTRTLAARYPYEPSVLPVEPARGRHAVELVSTEPKKTPELTMFAAVLHEPKKLLIDELDAPEPRAGQVRFACAPAASAAPTSRITSRARAAISRCASRSCSAMKSRVKSRRSARA